MMQTKATVDYEEYVSILTWQWESNPGAALDWLDWNALFGVDFGLAPHEVTYDSLKSQPTAVCSRAWKGTQVLR